MTIQGKIYTVTEFEQLVNPNDERRFELINGRVVEKVPTFIHGYIVAVLTAAIMNYLVNHDIGDALVEVRYRIPGDEHNDRIPDLSFVSHDKGDLPQTGPAPYMPDLAIEVQSPGQSEDFMTGKAEYYLANGSYMVWIIYPHMRRVDVFTPNDHRTLGEGDMLSGGDILPNFEIAIKPLFKKVK